MNISDGVVSQGQGLYDAGATATITITTRSGYALSDVLSDGESLGPVDSVTFENIASDHVVEALVTLAPPVKAVKLAASQVLTGEEVKINRASATVKFSLPQGFSVEKDSSFDVVVGSWSRALSLSSAKRVAIKTWGGTATFAKEGNAAVVLSWRDGTVTLKLAVRGGAANIIDPSKQFPSEGKAPLEGEIMVSLATKDFAST